MTGKELQALEHIDRNGNLMWMGVTGMQAERLFNTLIQDELIERNSWTGRWQVTKEGKNNL
jgi:hypothetical protein